MRVPLEHSVEPAPSGFATFLQGVKHRAEAKMSSLRAFFASPEAFYRVGARFVVQCIYRMRYTGFENIPATGGAILISNHVTYMDGALIHSAVKRRVFYVIDKPIYEVPAVKYFMDMCGAIPIEPTKESVAWALGRVAEVLQEGHLVCIFPEGQLTYTGYMTRFRFGIEWMAKESGVPVIPMAIKGMWGSILSRKYLRTRFPFLPRSLFRKVHMVCGDPIPWQQAKINFLQRRVMELLNNTD